MGKVYILTNEWIPFIKIGSTDRMVEDRINEISGKSSPIGWVKYSEVESEKYEEIEKHMHKILDAYNQRIWQNREYFKVEPERAVKILESALELVGERNTIQNETTNENEQDILIRPKREIFPLTKYAPIGSELTFTRDENIKCKIIDKKRVEYNNKIYSSLSNLADELLKEKYNYKGRVAGTSYFMYNGRILSEIRDDLYNEEE